MMRQSIVASTAILFVLGAIGPSQEAEAGRFARCRANAVCSSCIPCATAPCDTPASCTAKQTAAAAAASPRLFPVSIVETKVGVIMIDTDNLQTYLLVDDDGPDGRKKKWVPMASIPPK